MGLSLTDAKKINNGLRRLRDIWESVAAILLLSQETREEMATVREALQVLSDRVQGIEEDIPRVLAKVSELLAAISSGDVTLSPELQAQVDDVTASLDTLNAQMDAAVPPAVPAPEPTPEPAPTEPADGSSVL